MLFCLLSFHCYVHIKFSYFCSFSTSCSNVVVFVNGSNPGWSYILTHPVQRHPQSLDQQVLCDLAKLLGLGLFPQLVLQYAMYECMNFDVDPGRQVGSILTTTLLLRKVWSSQTSIHKLFGHVCSTEGPFEQHVLVVTSRDL